MIQAGINKVLTGVAIIVGGVVIGLLTLIDPYSVILEVIFNVITLAAGLIGGIYFIIGVAMLIFGNIEKFRFNKNYDLGPTNFNPAKQMERQRTKYNIKNLKNDYLEIPFDKSVTLKDCESWLIEKLRRKEIYVSTIDFETMFHLDGVVFESMHDSQKIQGVLILVRGPE